jgi:hypothetical protein
MKNGDGGAREAFHQRSFSPMTQSCRSNMSAIALFLKCFVVVFGVSPRDCLFFRDGKLIGVAERKSKELATVESDLVHCKI